MKSVTYFIERGWSLETSEVTKLWLFDESGVELLQGPFVEGVDFRLTRDDERRPNGVGFPAGAKCVGRDSVGRLLWLVKEKRVWYLKYALQEVDDLEEGGAEEEGGMVDLEYAVPVRVLDEELWKDIPGFEGYQAHPEGEVRVKKTRKILLCESRKAPYRATVIKGKQAIIHRLIAFTFLPNPDNLPQVNHKNGIKKDNRLINLEWVSRSQNMKHACSTGLNPGRQPKIPFKITMKDGSTKLCPSKQKAADYLEVTKSTIDHCLARFAGVYAGTNYRTREKDWLWKIEKYQIKPDPNIEERVIEIEGYTHLIARVDGIILSKKDRYPVGTVTGGRYLRVSGRNNTTNAIHRLIALTFIPNPENKPQVNHLDGDTKNNSVKNLEWCTAQENTVHAWTTGLHNEETKRRSSEKRIVPVYQLELDGQIIRRFESLTQVCEQMEYDPYKVCAGYTKPKPQHLSGIGYGWCYVSDYKEPLANRAFSGLFPELVGRKNIDFDILRPYIVRSSRPVWQMDIGGNKLTLWPSVTDTGMGLSQIINLRKAISSNLNTVADGHFWTFATYEEIIDPDFRTPLEIPRMIRKLLRIPNIKGVTLKKDVIELLAENTPENSNAFRINNRPFYQLTLEKEIIRAWCGPVKMAKELGYVENPVLKALKTGLHRSSHGYRWRYLKLQEMCDNVPEEFWE